MTIQTSSEHVRTLYSWSGTEARILKDKNIIFRAETDGEAIYENRQFVLIDGHRYNSESREMKTYDVCLLNYDYKQAVFYRGNFYQICGFRATTMDEVSLLEGCLKRIWSDVKYESYGHGRYDYAGPPQEFEMKGYVSLIHGHSTQLMRKITLADLSISYNEIKKKASNSGFDCDESLKKYSRQVSKYLMLSQERYESGRYNLKTQILKRLDAKIYFIETNKNK